MKQLEQARILLAKAIEDECAAAALSGNPGIGNAIIGFHCQQAAEKLLKALLSARSAVFRHTQFDRQAALNLVSRLRAAAEAEIERAAP